MIESIGSGLTTVIGWAGDVIDALVNTDGALSALLPVFSVGIAISLVFLGIKVVREVCWGAN